MAALDLDSKTSLASECEQSHIVSLRGMLKPISSVKWKKDSWMSHLYGTILKPSHTNRFTDWWTSSLRDTLANHSVPLESEQVKKTQDISGLGSQMEFNFFNQGCASLKMSKDTFRWDSPQSSVIWKNWVTKVRSEYSARVKLAQFTKGKECSSWPTANTRDWKDSVNSVPPSVGQTRGHSLGMAVAEKNWPTIKVGQAEDCPSERRRKTPSLDSIVKQELEMSGPHVPANHNTHGNRQGLSEQSQRNWQTFAPGTHNRGETPHRQVVKALVNGDKVKTQCLTVDQVFAEEIKGTNRQESWATPQASDHVEGARTELTSNQKCLGRDMKQWATPIMGDSHLASTPEVAQKRIEEGKVTLSRQTAAWATPQLQDGHNINQDSTTHKTIPAQLTKMNMAGKLNPRWVETLMGLPIGWVMPSCKLPVTIEPTNYDSSAMESCQPPQSGLFEF